MTKHPSQYALEAYFVGEGDAETAAHIEQCAHCQGRLTELQTLRSHDLDAEPPAIFFERPAIRSAFEQQARPVRRTVVRRWSTWAAVSGIFAVAMVVYFLVTPRISMDAFSDKILIKGEQMQLTVLRNRGTYQSQHQGHVLVRAGDQLRIRVRLGRATRLSAGVLTQDQTWMALATDVAYPAGEHFIHDDALVVDAPPSEGTIIVGRPDMVSQARRDGRYNGLTKMEIRPLP